MTIVLEPLGERAFLARFDAEDDARGWASAVRAGAIPGVVDVVLAYRSVAVFADPDRADLDSLERRLGAVVPTPEDASSGRLIRVPVLYDGEDLDDVAARLGLTREDVIRFHSGREYRVQAVGFLPGFPYCGDLPDGLAGLARRESPRARVPAGSVAIVGRQTGIYPVESPGGWHLIGRTPCRVADPARGEFPIAAGDRVVFAPVDSSEYRRREGESLAGIAPPFAASLGPD